MSNGLKITKLEFNSTQLERGLEIFQKEVNTKFSEESESVCKEILEVAKDKCPVDTGNLRDSGYVEKTQNGYTVGFSADYAAIVHEKPDGWQKSGETQFLSKAVKEVCGAEYELLKRRLLG